MPGDYPFENLGDERFQQLCQALLLREHRDVQCFPVGQPDGGRDATMFPLLRGRGKPFVVYQVKFSKAGLNQREPREWLLASMEDERAKAAELANLGASEYVIMTNVAGTAHLDVGTIDRLDELLKSFAIPARCLWRDDINRRLDDAWDLKWTFPEVMTGPDLIRAVIQSGVAEHQLRRTNALRSFITAQLQADRQVRFRQVDLETPLLDLFIDVPVVLGNQNLRRILMYQLALNPSGRRRYSSPINSLHQRFSHEIASWSLDAFPQLVTTQTTLGKGFSSKIETAFDGVWAEIEELYDQQERREGDGSQLGAAALLLDPAIVDALPCVVLEGAPGQGKSTVTQFLCQVHRMRVLGRDLSPLSSLHKPKAARLPLRADLRDFAIWQSRRDPFTSIDDGAVPANWEPSLEGFLAALIHHHSGGATFDVSDFQEVARVSSILLVLDGLDEVADASRRANVVKGIEDGVARIRGLAASAQVIVTSRPTAFATAPGLSEDDYPRLQLGPVTRPLIERYADAWLRTREVTERDAEDFKRTLTAKLELPHFKELARNPMQLAILLSLLNTRGASLPDKRTSLYESYIEVFFGRESEKDETVRKYRDLLLALHGYLGWLLHAEAEAGEGDERGRIRQDRLNDVVRQYLSDEGYDPSLADHLFVGVVERVVALVSRAQGTFEFEVQPLREFFAARYLYKTARYSRAGEEHSRGTKPDRFDVIARRAYWLNVTRFFAGFFDVGELPMLIERLRELADDPDYRQTSHPPNVIATLMSDWVFAQSPKTVTQAIAVLQPSTIRVLVSSSRRRGAAGDPLTLSDECGRLLLLDRAFELLGSETHWDYTNALIELAKANSSSEERIEKWRSRLSELALGHDSERARWVRLAFYLDIMHAVPETELVQELEKLKEPASVCPILIRAGQTRLFHDRPEWLEAALKAVLSGHLWIDSRTNVPSLLRALAVIVNPLSYSRGRGSVVALQDYLKRAVSDASSAKLEGIPDVVATKIRDSISDALTQLQSSKDFWNGRLTAWDTLIEGLRKRWGDEWCHVLLAIRACSARSRKSLESQADAEPLIDESQLPDSLIDTSQSLVLRVWSARRKAASKSWWTEQFAKAESDYDRALISLLFIMWSSPKTLEAIQGALDSAIRQLSPSYWSLLCDAVRREFGLRTIPDQGSQKKRTHLDVRTDLDLRTLSLLTLRLSDEDNQQIYSQYLQPYLGGDFDILLVASEQAQAAISISPEDWSKHVRTIAAAYAAGVGSTFASNLEEAMQKDSVPREMIDEVVSSPNRYPLSLLSAAERRVREEVNLRLGPVLTIAQQEGWFD